MEGPVDQALQSQDTPASSWVEQQLHLKIDQLLEINQQKFPKILSLSLDVWFHRMIHHCYYSPTVLVKGGISALRQTLASMGLEFISRSQVLILWKYYRASDPGD
jgi:hypothetical protein